MNRVGDFLRVTREELDIQQKEVYLDLNFAHSLISGHELGSRTIQLKHLVSYIDYYKLDRPKMIALWLADLIDFKLKDVESSETIVKELRLYLAKV